MNYYTRATMTAWLALPEPHTTVLRALVGSAGEARLVALLEHHASASEGRPSGASGPAARVLGVPDDSDYPDWAEMTRVTVPPDLVPVFESMEASGLLVRAGTGEYPDDLILHATVRDALREMTFREEVWGGKPCVLLQWEEQYSAGSEDVLAWLATTTNTLVRVDGAHSADRMTTDSSGGFSLVVSPGGEIDYYGSGTAADRRERAIARKASGETYPLRENIEIQLPPGRPVSDADVLEYAMQYIRYHGLEEAVATHAVYVERVKGHADRGIRE